MSLLSNARLLVGMKTKTISPSLYSLLLEDETGEEKFLHTCVSFSLEEASEEALEALRAQYPKLKNEDFHISMKIVRSVESILDELEELKVSPAEKRSDLGPVKNLLMREILENRDLDLLNRHQTLLNTYEKKYLADRLQCLGVTTRSQKIYGPRKKKDHKA